MTTNHQTYIINNIEEARRVLDAYFDGQSTLAEEEALKRYLLALAELPVGMEEDARLFMDLEGLSASWQRQQQEEAEQLVPEGMDSRLEATLLRLEQQEQPTLRPETNVNSAQLRIGEKPPRIGFRWTRLAAACVALVVVVTAGIRFYTTGTESQPLFTDTCSTPQEAEIQLNRALAMLNSKSQSGLEQVSDHLETFTASNRDISRFIQFD